MVKAVHSAMLVADTRAFADNEVVMVDAVSVCLLFAYHCVGRGRPSFVAGLMPFYRVCSTSYDRREYLTRGGLLIEQCTPRRSECFRDEAILASLISRPRDFIWCLVLIDGSSPEVTRAIPPHDHPSSSTVLTSHSFRRFFPLLIK